MVVFIVNINTESLALKQGSMSYRIGLTKKIFQIFLIEMYLRHNSTLM